MQIIEESPKLKLAMLKLDIVKVEQSHELKDTQKHKSRRARIQRNQAFQRRFCRGKMI